MDDEELIGYCSLHCKTERALFKGIHVNRMITLAGYPEDFVISVNEDGWYSLHEEMQELVNLARVRLAKEGV